MEGWVDLGIAVSVQPVLKAAYRSVFVKTQTFVRSAIRTWALSLQASMLPLDHCDDDEVESTDQKTGADYATNKNVERRPKWEHRRSPWIALGITVDLRPTLKTTHDSAVLFRLFLGSFHQASRATPRLNTQSTSFPIYIVNHTAFELRWQLAR